MNYPDEFLNDETTWYLKDRNARQDGSFQGLHYDYWDAKIWYHRPKLCLIQFCCSNEILIALYANWANRHRYRMLQDWPFWLSFVKVAFVTWGTTNLMAAHGWRCSMMPKAMALSPQLSGSTMWRRDRSWRGRRGRNNSMQKTKCWTSTLGSLVLVFQVSFQNWMTEKEDTETFLFL